MAKNIVKLNEAQLMGIVEESVKRTLNEGFFKKLFGKKEDDNDDFRSFTLSDKKKKPAKKDDGDDDYRSFTISDKREKKRSKKDDSDDDYRSFTLEEDKIDRIVAESIRKVLKEGANL